MPIPIRDFSSEQYRALLNPPSVRTKESRHWVAHFNLVGSPHVVALINRLAYFLLHYFSVFPNNAYLLRSFKTHVMNGVKTEEDLKRAKEIYSLFRKCFSEKNKDLVEIGKALEKSFKTREEFELLSSFIAKFETPSEKKEALKKMKKALGEMERHHGIKHEEAIPQRGTESPRTPFVATQLSYDEPGIDVPLVEEKPADEAQEDKPPVNETTVDAPIVDGPPPPPPPPPPARPRLVVKGEATFPRPSADNEASSSPRSVLPVPPPLPNSTPIPPPPPGSGTPGAGITPIRKPVELFQNEPDPLKLSTIPDEIKSMSKEQLGREIEEIGVYVKKLEAALVLVKKAFDREKGLADKEKELLRLQKQNNEKISLITAKIELLATTAPVVIFKLPHIMIDLNVGNQKKQKKEPVILQWPFFSDEVYENLLKQIDGKGLIAKHFLKRAELDHLRKKLQSLNGAAGEKGVNNEIIKVNGTSETLKSKIRELREALNKTRGVTNNGIPFQKFGKLLEDKGSLKSNWERLSRLRLQTLNGNKPKIEGDASIPASGSEAPIAATPAHSAAPAAVKTAFKPKGHPLVTEIDNKPELEVTCPELSLLKDLFLNHGVNTIINNADYHDKFTV